MNVAHFRIHWLLGQSLGRFRGQTGRHDFTAGAVGAGKKHHGAAVGRLDARAATNREEKNNLDS